MQFARIHISIAILSPIRINKFPSDFSKISFVVSSLNTSPIAGTLDSISSDMLVKSILAKTIYRITRIMDKTILVMNPIKAPLPADLAHLGFFPSYMRKRIKPTIGIKNPKSANPKLELSSGTSALCILSIRTHSYYNMMTYHLQFYHIFAIHNNLSSAFVTDNIHFADRFDGLFQQKLTWIFYYHRRLCSFCLCNYL